MDPLIFTSFFLGEFVTEKLHFLFVSHSCTETAILYYRSEEVYISSVELFILQRLVHDSMCRNVARVLLSLDYFCATNSSTLWALLV
jgi:hypothetical protein